MLTTINPDGTKTLYSYDSPIKYVDEEGYVRFIDSSLKPCGKADGLFDWYSYENTANDVKTYFPLFIGTGVLVESEQGDIRMTPKGSKISMSSKTEEDNTEYVLYEDVFDKDTDIRYTAINEGIKEDIILNAYNGNNTFEYIVEAEGLTPVRDTGKTIEFIDGNLQTAYTFGEIVLFDSADMPATNSNSHYTVEELKEGKYLVTLVIDEEFLTNEDTVYPVIVDPTTKQTPNIKKFRSTNYCSRSYMTSHDNSVDILTAENDGTPTGVMHLQMTDMNDFAHINPEKIYSAHLNLYLIDIPTCNFTLNVNTNNFSTEPTPESLEWLDVKRVANRTPDLSEFVVAGTSAIGLLITDIFKDWLTVETKSYMLSSRISKNDGLFISAEGMPSGYEIIICAPFHLYPSHFPSVTVTYEEDEELEGGFYRIQSGYYNQTARYLTANASGNVLYDLDANNSNQLWYIKKSTDEMMSDAYAGDYVIYSVGQKKYMSFNLINNTVGWYEQIEQPAQTLSNCALKIVDQSNGYKRIVNPSSKKQLAALNYGKENNTPIVQEVMKGLDNQRWKFEKVESFIDTNNPSTYQMVVGETEHLSYTAVDVNATFSISCTPPNSVISYRQSGDSLTTKHITVDAIGEGQATLTVSMTTNDAQTGGQRTTSVSWDFAVGAQTIAINKSTLSLNVGDTEDLDATSRPNLPIVWSSSNENVATVDSQGKVTAIGIGKTVINANISSGVTASCVVDVGPEVFITLMNNELINAEDVSFTDDGFYMCTKSLADILNNAGIYSLFNSDDEERICNNFFDDWFLYSVYDHSTVVYSLVKMREQEYENGSNYDNDDPGVTICFISFNTNILLNCLYNNSKTNKKYLYNEIDRVVRQKGQTYDALLRWYFNNPASVASYNIAELYIQHIVNSAESNCISLPKNYLGIFEDIALFENIIEQLEGRTDFDSQIAVEQAFSEIEKHRRVPNFIESINQKAGYIVCDDEKITIQSTSILSVFEKYAILATHTGNVSLNSFAAEVKYHAYALETWYGDWNLLDAYEKAIRADMSIGEEFESGITDQYYDLNSDIVQEQIQYHGQK